MTGFITQQIRQLSKSTHLKNLLSPDLMHLKLQVHNFRASRTVENLINLLNAPNLSDAQQLRLFKAVDGSKTFVQMLSHQRIATLPPNLLSDYYFGVNPISSIMKALPKAIQQKIRQDSKKLNLCLSDSEEEASPHNLIDEKGFNKRRCEILNQYNHGNQGSDPYGFREPDNDQPKVTCSPSSFPKNGQ